jgi:hypothetical protein
MPNISELSFSVCEIISFMLSSPNVNFGCGVVGSVVYLDE